jgi:hypothetical protein
MITSLEVVLRIRVRATSSRQPLALLSVRTGRFCCARRRLRVCAATGVGGAVTVTEVFAVASLPRSSTTLQVTLMVPRGAPAVLSVTVGVLLAIRPAEAEYE